MKNKNLFGEEYEEILDEPKETKPKERAYSFNPFALQDAIGEKNIKKMWLEYERLRFSGIEAEEIIHKIVSKVKEMAAIKRGAGKEDLGMKDYPFNKSKRDLKNWKAEELESFYAKLIKIYHLSRMAGGDDLDTATEKALLKAFNI